MKVIRIAPHKKPEVTEIENTLETLQHEVEGFIEIVYPFEDEVGIIRNEEGKINGLELNRALFDTETGEMYDIIAGTFSIAGLTESDFCDLTDEQIKTYTEMYAEPESFVRIGSEIRVIKG